MVNTSSSRVSRLGKCGNTEYIHVGQTGKFAICATAMTDTQKTVKFVQLQKINCQKSVR